MTGPLNQPPGLPGGLYTILDVTAAAVIKAAPGILACVLIQLVGSAGSLVLNDCATTGGATVANQVLNLAYSKLSPAQTITLAWPCQAGIVVSALPTGAQVSIAFT